MKIKKRKGFAPWRWYHWRFAVLPTWFGDGERIWLEPYQCRMNGLSGERRDRHGNVREFFIYV